MIEDTRDILRLVLGAGPRDPVIWTSGATEANNLALKGFAGLSIRNAILTSPFEHPSVTEVVKDIVHLRGFEERYFNVDNHQISPSGIAQQAESVGLVSLMLANNETGVIYPVPEIVREIRRISPTAFIHVDAVQAVGRIPILMHEWGVDAITVSGHKIGALPGVGALVIRAGYLLNPEILGGSQESGMRAGTQPVPAILSLKIALKSIDKAGGRGARANRMNLNRNAFLAGLEIEKDDSLELNVPKGVSTLPNTASIRVKGVSADDLVVAADLAGVLISSGAACSSGTQRPSPVLLAAGLSERMARESIRVSVTDSGDVDQFFEAGKIVASCIQRLKAVG
jgi:cysteine desulfurase